MCKLTQIWDFNAPNHLFVAAFWLVLFGLPYGCQENTPLVNEAARQDYERFQAQFSPMGPFSGQRAATANNESASTRPENSQEASEASSPRNIAPSGNPSQSSDNPAPNQNESNDPHSTDPPPPGEVKHFVTSRIPPPSQGTQTTTQIHMVQSTVLSPGEVRPVIFIPPSEFQVGLIRRGYQDVTLQTHRYEPIGDTFDYNCDPVDKRCFRLPSTLEESRNLELAITWVSREIPLVTFRHGTADHPTDKIRDFIEIRHDPNYLGAEVADIFDRQPPPIKWKAFLFSEKFAHFDRVYNTADLYFKETRDVDVYQIDLVRFESSTSPGPWKSLRVDLRDELPWRMQESTRNTLGMEIYLSEDERNPSMTGKILYPNGGQVWFIAFPEETLPILASVGR